MMPKQGQSVESCIVSEFRKKPGDTVKVGDVLFGYETDKATFEEEAKVEGTVLAVFFKDGDEIPVLTNVMAIGNVMMQARAAGLVKDRREMRRIVAKSFDLKLFIPGR